MDSNKLQEIGTKILIGHEDQWIQIKRVRQMHIHENYNRRICHYVFVC